MSLQGVTVLGIIFLFQWFSPPGFSQTWDIPDSIRAMDTLDAGQESRAIELNLGRVRESLIELSREMNTFEFDGIHPRLEKLYVRYDLMALWAERWSGTTASDIEKALHKIKKRTEVIHRMFDMGEMQVSQIKLSDLIYHVETQENKLFRVSKKSSPQKGIENP